MILPSDWIQNAEVSAFMECIVQQRRQTIKTAILLVKYKLKWDHIARRLNPDVQNHRGFLKGVTPKLKLEK